MLCAGWKHLLLIIQWIPDAVTDADLSRLLYIVKEKDTGVIRLKAWLLSESYLT